jgi:hypothetical protein
MLFKRVCHTRIDIAPSRIHTLIKTTEITSLIRHIRFFIKEINDTDIHTNIFEAGITKE